MRGEGTLASPMVAGVMRWRSRTGATQASHPHTTLPPPSRVGILGGDRHIRRGGSGGEWSGDACVALAGGERRSREGDEGDASVPTPPNPTPAPTSMKALPRRIMKYLPVKAGEGLCVEGTLASNTFQ